MQYYVTAKREFSFMAMPPVVWCGPMSQLDAEAHKATFDAADYTLQHGELKRPLLQVVERGELTREQLSDLRFLAR